MEINPTLIPYHPQANFCFIWESFQTPAFLSTSLAVTATSKPAPRHHIYPSSSPVLFIFLLRKQKHQVGICKEAASTLRSQGTRKPDASAGNNSQGLRCSSPDCSPEGSNGIRSLPSWSPALSVPACMRLCNWQRESKGSQRLSGMIKWHDEVSDSKITPLTTNCTNL